MRTPCERSERARGFPGGTRVSPRYSAMARLTACCTSWARRMLESWTNASPAPASATAATATPATAITSVALTGAQALRLAEREDDRILSRVVGRVLLLRHRLNVHLHRRPGGELHLAEVVERNCPLLARVDQVDRLRLDDRRRSLLDR